MTIRKYISSLVRSRAVAIAMGELPPKNCSHLFRKYKESEDSHWNRTVHMISSTPLLGRTHYSQLSEYISYNAAHSFYLWNDGSALEYMCCRFEGNPILQIYKEVPHRIVKADIFRLCILQQAGGIYLDLKSQVSENLCRIDLLDHPGYLIQESHVLEQNEIVEDFCLPTRHRLANWFLAFRPSHPFIGFALAEIIENYNVRGFSYEPALFTELAL